MSGKHKGLTLLFLAFVGMGFLGGMTGLVATAEQNIPKSEREPALVYNTGMQPAGQAAATGTAADKAATATDAASTDKVTAETASLDTSVFSNKGCIQCHAIPGLNVSGGTTGPDLTLAINNVPSKYGKSLAEFLQQPEGIMAEVLPSKNVSDDEKAQIVDLLTKAAEQSVGGQAAEQPTEQPTEA